MSSPFDESKATLAVAAARAADPAVKAAYRTALTELNDQEGAITVVIERALIESDDFINRLALARHGLDLERAPAECQADY